MLCSTFIHEEPDNSSDFQLISHVSIFEKGIELAKYLPSLLNTGNDRPEKEFITPNPMKSLHFAFAYRTKKWRSFLLDA